MNNDSVAREDASRQKAAAEFVGSCVCTFCRHVNRSQIYRWGPELERHLQEYAKAEMAGMARLAEPQRRKALALITRAVRGRLG